MDGFLVGFSLSLLTIFVIYSIIRGTNLISRILRITLTIGIIIAADSNGIFDIFAFAFIIIVLTFFIELLFMKKKPKENKAIIPDNEGIDIRFYSTPMYMTKIMVLFVIIFYGETAYPGDTEVPDHVYVFLAIPLIMLLIDGIIIYVKNKRYRIKDNFFPNYRLKRLDSFASMLISVFMLLFCVFSQVTEIELAVIIFFITGIVFTVQFFKYFSRERAFSRLLAGKIRHTHFSLRFAYGKLKNLDWAVPEKKEGFIARTKRKTTGTVKQGKEKVKQGFYESKKKLKSLFHKK